MKKYYEEIYSDIQLLFVTPEWLFSSNNLDRVRELAINNKLSLIAIDEAHLIFDWQTFRDKCRYLENIKRDVPTVPVMALTVTASSNVLTKLKSLLHNPYISQSSVNRQNIYYRVENYHQKVRKQASIVVTT